MTMGIRSKFTTLVLFGAATIMLFTAGRAASAQTPSPPGVSSAVSGAGISGGTTATHFGVTIANRLNGDVTIALGEGRLTITSVAGTTPFTFTPETAAGCNVRYIDSGTVAECSAPPGSNFVLIPAAGALPGTGTGGLQADNGLTFQGTLAALLVIAAFAAAGIRAHVGAGGAVSGQARGLSLP